eukprot:UN02045
MIEGKKPRATTFAAPDGEDGTDEEESEDEPTTKKADNKKQTATEKAAEAKAKAAPATATKRGRGAAKKDDADASDDEDVKKPAPRKAAKKAADDDAAAKTTKKDASDDEDEDDKKKSVPVQGNVSSKKSYPTDYRVPNAEDWVVVMSKDDSGNPVPLDFMLNQTNIAQNNNKFYLVQVLQSIKNPSKYAVINVWGRVNENGQKSFTEFSSLSSAMAAADKKVKDKCTHNINTLLNNPNIETKPGKYTYLRRVMPNADDEEDEEEDEEEKEVKSKLHPRVQSFMELITDTTMVNAQLASMDFDTNKMPLGSLSKDVVRRAMVKLTELKEAIDNKSSRSVLINLTNQYYTLIPHDFGRRTPPVIDTLEMIKKEQTIVMDLNDLESGQKVLQLKQTKTEKLEEHPLDTKYKAMDIDLKYVEPQSDEYQLIEKYMFDTIGETHRSWFDYEIVDIFSVNKQLENERQAKWLATPEGQQNNWNRNLLWHGSRIGNFSGILTSSLRLPKDLDPSIKIQGAMFDAGSYSADASSKSFQYCSTTPNGDGCILLLEVVCAQHEHMYSADYNASDHMRPGANSIKGLGRYFPNEDGCKYVKLPKTADDKIEICTRAEMEAAGRLEAIQCDTANDSGSRIGPVTLYTTKKEYNDWVKVPMGKLETNPSNTLPYLVYNEYIVFKSVQIKIKYVIRWKTKQNKQSRY